MPPDGRKTEDLSSSVWTLANGLSLLRILLVPVFVLAVAGRRPGPAFLVFFVAGMTDLLDGLAARACRQRSRLGTYLDPAGDKLLMAASYIVLSLPSLAQPNVIPLWLTVLVFARDLLIVSGAAYGRFRLGLKTFLPSLTGKISTGFQVGTVFWVLFFNVRGTTPGILAWLYGATVILTVLSGAAYFRQGLKILRASRA
ncbi:MAG: CDP-alcohol phosphatidyltransferase family protein [Candidatus Aminicenantes bacterium]|nr:CDP-alcohol phosphatidyltransferase family protein [Candidatus Aminicenantes bacterium]